MQDNAAMDRTEDQVEESALVNWKNAPTLKDMKQDLLDATPFRSEQVARIDAWLDNLKGTGKAAVKTGPNSSKMVPKLIRKQAEWRYPALSEPFLSRDDVFNVKPVTWQDRKAAQQNQVVLNNQFNTQINKVDFIDEFVRTAVDEGTVILRTGWEFVEEEYEGTFPEVQYVINPEFGPMHEQLAQLKQEDPGKYEVEVPEELQEAHQMTIDQGQPVEPQVIGQITEKRMRTLVNRPTVEVCDYRNVTIDPTCRGNIDKASFVIYSFETSLSALKKDKRYKNLDKVNVGANGSVLAEPDHAASTGVGDFNFSDKPRKKIVCYEYWGYWDINGDGTVVPFVMAWVGDTIIRLEENPYPDKKLPFIVCQYLPVRRSTHGEPDGELLEDNQKIIGAVTRGMIDIMAKSANGQTGMRRDMLDVTNRRKFDRGLDYEFNANVDPRVGVHMHTYPEIPQSAQFMIQLQNMEAESLTGVKSFSQGVSGSSLGDVAAGVRGALDAASKRELAILRRMVKALIAVGRKFISMNGEFLSDKEVIRITDEEYVTVRRDDLAGNFDLKLSISTAEEDDKKSTELAFMLQTMGNNMDPELSKMILSDIARLRKMPDLAKKIESYQPQPDPMAQKRAELEIMLLEAQIQNEMAQAAKLQAGAQLDAAKVGTESAKQTHMQSDADLKNLNFVEQESGVTQERDLQKHGAQAESQLKMKIVDRQFKKEDQKMDILKEYIKSKASKSK